MSADSNDERTPDPTTPGEQDAGTDEPRRIDLGKRSFTRIGKSADGSAASTLIVPASSTDTVFASRFVTQT